MVKDQRFWMIEMDAFDCFEIFETKCAGKQLSAVSMVLQLPLAFVGNNVFFLFSFVFLWSVLCFNYQYIACWQEIQPHCLEQTVQYLSYNCLFSFGLSVNGIPICFDLLVILWKIPAFIFFYTKMIFWTLSKYFSFTLKWARWKSWLLLPQEFPLKCC